MEMQSKAHHRLRTPPRKMLILISLKTHTFVIIILLSSILRGAGGKPAQNEVVIVEGHEADLPCVTTPMAVEGEEEEEENDKRGKNRPAIIVWYKDGVGSSIYSYDGRDLENERHWSPRRSMGGRLSLKLPDSFNTRPQLAFLNIGHTHETDAGVYNCRVEFKRGPGRRTYTNLTVVGPPATPMIEVWAGGRFLLTTQETSTATVEVGATLSLRCSTSGGNPRPTVTWWRGGQQLLGRDTTEDGIISSSVNVTVVAEDAHTPIVCQASNTHLMPPLRTPLLLLVLSPPKWLRVIGADKPMSAGMTYTVECRCVGARPPPVITWSVGGDELTHATSTTDVEGETTSRLRFTPKAAHVGTHITCTARPPDHTQWAASPHFTPSLWVKSDSSPLKILYKPQVHLTLQVLKLHNKDGGTKDKDKEDGNSNTGLPIPFSPSTAINHNPFFKSNQSANSQTNNDGEIRTNEGKDGEDKTMRDTNDNNKLKKGRQSSEKTYKKDREGIVSVEEYSGVVLQCNVRANPPAYHVSWYKNGIPLSPVTSPGLVVGNMSAVFPSLKRGDAGALTCTAHNTEGSTRSDPVQLYVKHGPECVRNTVKIIGVPRHHALNVTCEVEAYPLPTSFTWALKSSRGILAVPPEMINFSGTTSWIKYTPRANVDFGDLLCWAHTPSDRQEEPCVAQLVSAEKPDTPEDCHMTLRASTKLTVSCKAAHDGGLPQTFFMRVFHAGLMVANSTSVSPVISVYDLEPDTRYRLTIWSANTHGTSTGHTTLYASTKPSNSSSTTSSMNGHSSKNPKGLLSKFGSSFLAVVVVVTVVGVVIGIVVGIMVRRGDGRDSNSRHPRDEEDEGEERPPTLINNNQINVAMAGIGRRVPKCLEPLGKSTTHYDKVTSTDGKNDKHVYDDPITLRGGCTNEETQTTENIEVTQNIHYPSFSITAADLGYQSQSFSWHLPNSRLLRNKFNQRYPAAHRGCLRKPMRVEPPRLPEFDLSTRITTRRKMQPHPGMEFRLILVPETSKMIQVALERDTRLASYLSQDAHHLTNSPMKFPTISEEDELKPLDAFEENSATPYESTPDDFTIENGQSDTSELLPRNNNIVETRAMVHNENQQHNRNNNQHYRPLHSQMVSETAYDGLQITPDNIPTITIYGNEHTKLASPTNEKYSKSQQTNYFPDVPWETDESRMKVALLGHQQREKRADLPSRPVPAIPLLGKFSRHHPYGNPLSGDKRGFRAPPAPSVKRKMEKTVNSSGGNNPNLIPSSPFSLLRKPKVGVTSLLSLVSSTSSSSSSSSCPSKRGGRGSRETTTSPLSECRRRVSCGAKRSSFKNLKSQRPRSVHYISGPEQVLHCCDEMVECLSASTPSSPRSSTSSSSSCFPYSSMSSSPVSSFYSSENSLSISASFSPSSSSSSFCFSSTSSSASSSPFSSFLSPSLTSHSSSSILSLSSCSPTTDSVLSGDITPS